MPFAFTEHGALMAASVLHSEHAIEVSVYDAICRYGYRPISELNCRNERENPLHG